MTGKECYGEVLKEITERDQRIPQYHQRIEKRANCTVVTLLGSINTIMCLVLLWQQAVPYCFHALLLFYNNEKWFEWMPRKAGVMGRALLPAMKLMNVRSGLRPELNVVYPCYLLCSVVNLQIKFPSRYGENLPFCLKRSLQISGLS